MLAQKTAQNGSNNKITIFSADFLLRPARPFVLTRFEWKFNSFCKLRSAIACLWLCERPLQSVKQINYQADVKGSIIIFCHAFTKKELFILNMETF